MEYIVKDYETRYFAGIELKGGVDLNKFDGKKIPNLWNELMNKHLPSIPDIMEPEKCIGLEQYPFDFMETRRFDYYALFQTTKLIEGDDEIITKKLPKGKYISFPIQFDDIRNEIARVYKYIKDKELKVHMGFDVEDYLPDQDYTKGNAVLHMTFLLEE